MYKLISIFLLINLMAVAKGQDVNCTSRNFDLFAELRRQQNKHNIQDYDTQINAFNQNYNERLDDIIKNAGFLVASSIQKVEELTQLQYLGDDYQRCFNKYRNYVPNVTQIESAINGCIQIANSTRSNLLVTPNQYRTNLRNYYYSSFEKNIKQCQSGWLSQRSKCFTQVDSDCNTVTLENQQGFATSLKNSECSANTNISNAILCSFEIHNHTISSMTETSTLINNCITK